MHLQELEVQIFRQACSQMNIIPIGGTIYIRHHRFWKSNRQSIREKAISPTYIDGALTRAHCLRTGEMADRQKLRHAALCLQRKQAGM